MRFTERREILTARLDERMLRRKHRTDDLARAPIAALGLVVVADALAHDAQVVEGACQIGMRPTELDFLVRKRIPKVARRVGKVAGHRRLLGGRDCRSDSCGIRHQKPAGSSTRVVENRLTVSATNTHRCVRTVLNTSASRSPLRTVTDPTTKSCSAVR